MTHKTLICTVSCVATLVFAASGLAVDLFTIDRAHDTLVRVDTSTGTATVVGSLGFDLADGDLTFLDGKLYAVSSGRPAANGKSQLLQIDCATGAAVSVVDVLYNGSPHAGDAEGLGVRGGKLVVSFGADAWSDRLGELDPLTGVISNASAVNIPETYFGRVDIDGMAMDGAGVLFGWNGETTFNELYNLDTNTRLGINNNYATDDIWFDGPTLYGIGGADGISLRTYDPATGATLTSVSLAGAQSGANFIGLAAAPEPASMCLLLLGGAFISRRRR